PAPRGVTPAGKRCQTSARVFEARPSFFDGTSSVRVLLRGANQNSCIQRLIKDASGIFARC
ncbi:TPA: hypothetical protein ACGCF2_003539, partial [Stenotrophomonas maltophilia]